jgi:DNA repair protein RadD
MILRDYQEAMKAETYAAWQEGHRNVLAVAPTGAGKTDFKAAIFSECKVPAWSIAHRQELVLQHSLTLGRWGVYHKIVAPDPVIKFCIGQQIEIFGRSFHHNQAPMVVAGIDTLNARAESLIQTINQARIWDIDEAHHVLKNNKWGKGVERFKNAWGLGVTASPRRADRKALGRHKSGVFDKIVIGPTMRELINRGYLSDFRMFVPPQSIDTRDVPVSETTGEFNQEKLRAAAHRSTITGDIVDHYLKLAAGKRGITFCVDVDIAIETAKAFEAKGVPAVAVTNRTDDRLRTAYMKRFRAGEILQMVNVDLFGEGLDVPAVEVVSMGRPTYSFQVFVQQFGRAMRPFEGKPFGMVLDHVGNIKRHWQLFSRAMNDRSTWLDALDDQERGRRKLHPLDNIPITTCVQCFQPFEAVTNRCPFCGYKIEPGPGGRNAPEFVDGDLIEFDPVLMAAIVKERDRVDGPPQIPYGVGAAAVKHIENNWRARQNAQSELRDTIALWAGVQREVFDRPDSEIYRRFYFMFGVDVATAQTLNAEDATKLTEQIRTVLT